MPSAEVMQLKQLKKKTILRTKSSSEFWLESKEFFWNKQEVKLKPNVLGVISKVQMDINSYRYFNPTLYP